MTSLPARSFTRSDGEEIELVEGYFESKDSFPYDLDTFHEFVERAYREENYPSNYGFFLNKVLMTQYLVDTLERIEVDVDVDSFERMLDLATGPAVQPRLMKMLGFASEIWCVDPKDRRDDYPNEEFKGSILQLRKKLLESDNNQYKELIKKVLDHHINNISGQPHYPHSLLDVEIKKDYDIEVDRFFEEDFHNFQRPDQSFDLITAFSCLSQLDVPYTFDTVYELLEPGGIFYFDLKNFYYFHGGEMHLPMDVPWLHARMTQEDLLRYYQELRPEYYDDAKEAMFIETTHLTTEDLRQEAHDVGFEVRYVHKQLLDEDIPKLFNLAGYVKTKVLPQAQDINPNVTLMSFFRKYRTMILQKPA
jgi:SAM-dependent methyltransferase